MVYGYIRVSTKEQNIERQMVVLSQYVENGKNIFTDYQSGKDFNRPEYRRLLQKLKPDDLIVIKSIDRLGRNYDEILEEWHLITKIKKADIFVVDFPLLDTRKKEDNGLTGAFIADLVLQILSYVAETEREFIRQRQAEGIRIAKAKGVRFGRRPVALPQNFEEIKALYTCKKLSARDAASLSNMKPSTFYKYVKKGAVKKRFKKSEIRLGK